MRNLPGVESRYGNLDLVIFRENTEDLYSGLEHTVVPGVVESLKIITEKATMRIAKAAFAYARKEGRKKNGDQERLLQTRNFFIIFLSVEVEHRHFDEARRVGVFDRIKR